MARATPTSSGRWVGNAGTGTFPNGPGSVASTRRYVLYNQNRDLNRARRSRNMRGRSVAARSLRPALAANRASAFPGAPRTIVASTLGPRLAPVAPVPGSTTFGTPAPTPYNTFVGDPRLSTAPIAPVYNISTGTQLSTAPRLSTASRYQQILPG